MPEFQSNISLKSFNTFGVDVPARFFVQVHSLVELQAVLADTDMKEKPRLVLGGGSNILLTRPFDGLVIKLSLHGRDCVAEDADAVYVKGMAGENWHDFVQWTIAQGWAGLENLSLIPGTVGASPIQNVGAYGVEMKDLFHQLTALDTQTGRLCTLAKAECQFGYRDSVFKHGEVGRYIIVDVTFRLPKVPTWHTGYGEVQAELIAGGVTELNAQSISQAICDIRRRKLPDPTELGNAGSFFKNPIVAQTQADVLKAANPTMPVYPQAEGKAKLAAGWLIDQCGWKGFNAGAAGVYAKQALVLVNHGGATGPEIYSLAKQIQQSVMQRFGVEIEPEPLIL
ncbi:UDP-N-acetylmuramate dehydrogenase [Chitinivorax sp. B]|uniref:UDP-N-acetylmuramate dehydrogenase n=1 Tax=Chitinivorax sp. B TaxID=2502235 RepID=UPI0010F8442D|nr:UDP-N-acetylmuramate dehydrogenase [Chitinivorax sp. B]